jgi:hypothetical protein
MQVRQFAEVQLVAREILSLPTATPRRKRSDSFYLKVRQRCICRQGLLKNNPQTPMIYLSREPRLFWLVAQDSPTGTPVYLGKKQHTIYPHCSTK